MGRFDLTDKEWQRIEPIFPSGMGRKGHPSDTRHFVNAAGLFHQEAERLGGYPAEIEPGPLLLAPKNLVPRAEQG